MTLARIRWRGALALAAGIIQLLGVPLYQDVILGRTGYLDATNAIAQHHQYGPYLLWASAHPALDTGYRVAQMLVFVLALVVPGVLRRILWPGDPRGGRGAMWIGLVGFALYALILVYGAISTPGAASAYAAAPSAAARAAILSGYQGLFAIKTLFASVLGGGLIALFLIQMCMRGTTSLRMPNWLSYLGLATGGLLAGSAILSLFALTQPESALSPLAFLGLAFWLIALGFLLLRIQTRPREEAASAGQDAEQDAPAAPAPAREGGPLA
jgi:hypothetical protein